MRRELGLGMGQREAQGSYLWGGEAWHARQDHGEIGGGGDFLPSCESGLSTTRGRQRRQVGQACQCDGAQAELLAKPERGGRRVHAASAWAVMRT